METLQFFLFGSVRVLPDPVAMEGRLTRSIQALLAYLLLQRHRMVSREAVADLFWGETGDDRARASLNTALWRLRRILEPKGVAPGTYLITTSSDLVGFNRHSRHWLDIEVFDEKLRPALEAPGTAVDDGAVQELEDALALYTGDLLEGFYEDWALREREHIRLKYLDGMAWLMAHYERSGELEKSIQYGMKILDHDPLREEIHRAVIRLHDQLGNRPLAIRQYQACAAILKEELGIPPMPETQRQYQRLLEAGTRRTPSAAPRNVSGMQKALQQLNQANQILDQACEEMRQVTNKFEQAQWQYQLALQSFETVIKDRESAQ